LALIIHNDGRMRYTSFSQHSHPSKYELRCTWLTFYFTNDTHSGSLMGEGGG